MDRISKALEMAKQKRKPSQPVGGREQLNSFTYSKTRQLNVSPEVLRRNKVLGGIVDKRISDAYGMLRTRVLQRMRQNGWKTLGITSAGPSVGKTLTAINLGISIARDHAHSVLLVDADLRRPNVHRFFELDVDEGLNECLQRKVTTDTIMLNPGIEHFVILPGSHSVDGAAVLLSSPSMTTLVTELKERYPDRFVLFDLPPVMVGDDVVAFAPLLDALLLVVKDGCTTSDELTRTVELLEGNEIIGTVLNFSSDPSSSSYDYYENRP